MKYEHRTSALKTIIAGMCAGLVGALAMNQFQEAVSAVTNRLDEKRRERESQAEPEEESSGGDDATVKAAQALSSAFSNHVLTDSEKAWAGPAVHYSVGAILGAGYSAAAGDRSIHTGHGIAYGSAAWLGADEIAVPLLKLSGPPNETPLSGHLQALSSHLVFGVLTHWTRKLILS